MIVAAGIPPRFLVFDIETVVDGRLVQKTKFPGEPGLSPKEARTRYRNALLEKSQGQSDFIPPSFHVPIAVAVAKVSEDFRLIDAVTLDRPRFRSPAITRIFWEGWRKYRCPTFVTFNGRRFDLPVMELAAFRYGVDTQPWFTIEGPNYKQPRYRYHYASHLDLYDLLTNAGAVSLDGGLDLLADLVGKPGKMDVKGAMVEDLWEAGEREKIDDYCLCDVLDTYFVFLRTQVVMGKLPLDREQELVAQAHAWISGAAAGRPGLERYLSAFAFWKPVGDDDDPFVPADGMVPGAGEVRAP